MNSEYQERINEIENLIEKINHTQVPSTSLYTPFKPGISVIIPTYKGEEYISNCLESIVNQTLSSMFYEVIVVINGAKDATETIIDNLIKENHIDNITVLYEPLASVTNARNVGIELANREFTVFVDDDDFISENYLEKMYQYSRHNSVAISQIVDIDQDGNYSYDNTVNNQIIKAEELNYNNLNSLGHVMSMNACKCLPTYIVKNHKFVDLRSGEDVVFTTALFTTNKLNVKIIPTQEKAIYYRLVKDGSISRQHHTFDFCITQRLEVISYLDALLSKLEDAHHAEFVRRKIRGQLSFVRKYLSDNSQETSRVKNEISKHSFSDITHKAMDEVMKVNARKDDNII
ncbi:glycosyltransferase [Aquibacillus sp. 3ASR75-11]|uniref:Glycosyltransferase n=1 Tax=Terrihalobacillus insolitus TaxID=2950438 RepID=A0A9X4AMH6_9BACI|nr:glycosyltransferase family 2 protein [Terrihalobacillus insolitus]MDC3411828.1 glycosyltransferase [Terrihalobacillus insolitus]MDC3423505.1 glycosyltransferase [Terrihalobacillus insolitus]